MTMRDATEAEAAEATATEAAEAEAESAEGDVNGRVPREALLRERAKRQEAVAARDTLLADRDRLAAELDVARRDLSLTDSVGLRSAEGRELARYWYDRQSPDSRGEWGEYVERLRSDPPMWATPYLAAAVGRNADPHPPRRVADVPPGEREVERPRTEFTEAAAREAAKDPAKLREFSAAWARHIRGG